MRNFTRQEANDFISEGLNIHPTECRDTGRALVYESLHMDRDTFDEELQYFAHDQRIPLNFGAFTYGENDMEVLTVRIPYEGAV